MDAIRIIGKLMNVKVTFVNGTAKDVIEAGYLSVIPFFPRCC